MTSHRRSILGLALALTFSAAACGGGSASNGPGGSTGASASATAPSSASEEPGGPTDGPAATPAPTQGGGGGTAADACSLITAEEAGATLGADGESVEMNTPGDVSFCIYSDASGGSNLATSWMRRGGSGSFAIWKAGAGVQEVAGLGDDAVFDPASATLLVLKGDAILSIAAGDGSADEAQRLAWAKTLAGIALGRM